MISVCVSEDFWLGGMVSCGRTNKANKRNRFFGVCFGCDFWFVCVLRIGVWEGGEIWNGVGKGRGKGLRVAGWGKGRFEGLKN